MSESYGCRKLVYLQIDNKIWYDRLAYNESEVSRGFKESRYPCGTNSEFGRVFLGNSANDSNCQSCGYEMPSFNFG